MKKISLNLNQETPFILKQTMVNRHDFSHKNSSPFKKTKEIIKPKENYSISQDFSGISPIKKSQQEIKDHESSFQSFLPGNQLNIFNSNVSKNEFKNDLSWTNDSVFQTTRRLKGKMETSKQHQKFFNNLNSSLSIINENFYKKEKKEEKENYQPNKFAVFSKRSLLNKKTDETTDSMLKKYNIDIKNNSFQLTTEPLDKFNSDKMNICEYVDDFEKSYNLQICMLNKEYKNQYFFVAIFLLIWIYFIGFVMTKCLISEKNIIENNEYDYIFIFFDYLKYVILLTMVIFSRMTSFESNIF